MGVEPRLISLSAIANLLEENQLPQPQQQQQQQQEQQQPAELHQLLSTVLESIMLSQESVHLQREASRACAVLHSNV